MKNMIILLLVLALFMGGCGKNYLEVNPIGTLNDETLATKTGVNGLLNGAYSLLDGVGSGGANFWNSMNVFDTMASDDAHVGTEPNASLGAFEFFTHDPTHEYLDPRWRLLYAGVQRSNDVLRILAKVTELSDSERQQFEAEAKFLRGVYHFEAAKIWRNVPYIDETVSYNDNNYNIPNKLIWDKIEEDFLFASNNLTATKNDVGRANKWAAKAFLVKVYMFQQKYTQAHPLLEDIIQNGMTSNGLKYDLNEHYFDNFSTEKKHGPEAVFVVQMSVYDGASGNNGNAGDFYNGPYGGPATCCYGWLQPSFDLVNAYQTDPNTGLPLLDTYMGTLVKNDQGIPSATPFTPHEGTLDARLDWVVGRRGIPFLDWGVHPGMAWIRQQSTGGPYSVIKNIAWQARVATDREGGYATNNPYNMIRFADVLLWAAEVEVEIGDLSKAESYVNRIRTRAAKPSGWVKKYLDDAEPLKGFSSEPAANYKVGLYSGQFSLLGKEYARKAVRFERRLELALEHHRFFDLQRYDGGSGYMAEVLNRHLEFETNIPNYNDKAYKPTNAKFIKGKNEVYPIPQIQIDLSVQNGVPVLKQNPGYF